MPADLPLSHRSAPRSQPGGLDSPLQGIILGIAIGAAVMLVIGLTWLVIDKFKPPNNDNNNPSSLVGAGLRPALTPAIPTLGSSLTPTDPPGPNPALTPTIPTARAGFKPAPTETTVPLVGAGLRPALTPAIPTAETASPPAPTATVVPGTLTYTVQPGDSLYQIAKNYNVDVLDLMIANHIANPSLIMPGQVFTIPGPGTLARGPQPTGPKSILVDISQQHLYAYQGNTLVYSFTVSTGVDDGTLRGSFQILDKLPRPYSAVWSFWMPDWLGFYYAGGLENGFHALPVLADGSQMWGAQLGTPVSYGCVVLGTLEAQLLYAWADVGTPVKVQ